LITFQTILLLRAATGGWGAPAGTLLDLVFAYGALILLVVLVALKARSAPDPA
jgi:hypothetical protein